MIDAARLITLTGAPGIGKSRLALELARQLASDYPDAYLVELVPVRDPALLPGALASALSLQEVPGTSLMDAAVAKLRDRRPLLVLDNCEHLLAACAKLVDALLGDCPQLRVLATSREPLTIAAERVWRVPELSFPDPSDQPLPELLKGYEAVRLFVERASAMQPGFALNSYVAPAVAEICRRLDGIPLAIELAAARVETHTPGEIARRLDDRFGLLTQGSHSALSRHHTLQAALELSHDLLSTRERALLRRLSVFAGSFDLEAAEAVGAGGEVEAGDVRDLLAGLMAKSLLVADTGSPQARHRLLETIRAYAADRLEEAGETAALREVHARFYLDLAEQAEPQLTGPTQERWLERLDFERPNLRSALDWSLGHGRSEWALRLCGALVLFWRVRCHFSEGRELLDAVVAASDGTRPEFRAKAVWGAGFLALMTGDADSAVSRLEESLAGFRDLGDTGGCARALMLLGNCSYSRCRPDALSQLEESAALAREADDPWCLSHALAVAGLDHGRRNDLPAARGLFEESLEVARRGEDKQGLRLGLLGLGSIAVRQGNYDEAEPLLEEAVAVASELGEDYIKATALQYLGQLGTGRGDYDKARKVLDDALALLRELGPPDAPSDTLVFRAELAYAEGDRPGARRRFEEAQALAREIGVVSLSSVQGLGELAAAEGDRAAACRLFGEALELARGSGNRLAAARALHGLGRLARAEGDTPRAAALHTEALALQRVVGSAPGITASLEALGGLAAEAGCYEHAARLLGAATALREQNGYAPSPLERSIYEADLALVQRGLSPEQLEADLAKGAGLSLEQAIDHASSGLGRRGRPATGWASLTQAERRAALLVGEGLTNREIAERLFVSPGTVKTHLSSVFSKLGLAGRRELAREVWRREEQPGGEQS